MGQAVARAIDGESDLALAGTWKRGDDLGAIVSNADVLIDFSLPGATREVLDAVTGSGTPLVYGVTGLDEDLVAALAATALEQLLKLLAFDELLFDQIAAEQELGLSDLAERDVDHSVSHADRDRTLGPAYVQDPRLPLMLKHLQ